MTTSSLNYLFDSDPEPDAIPEAQPAIQDPPGQVESIPAEPIKMPLPPLDQQFQTDTEGYIALNNYARQHGYALVTSHSKRTKKGVKKTVRLRCDRYGPPGPQPRHTDETSLARNTGTRDNGCPFGISLRLNLDSQLWNITVENSSHNHGPSQASTHPILRRIEIRQKKETIQHQLKQGISASKVLSGIRDKEPDTCNTP
ncbi:hypothetical protein N7535_008087 [Penicillium sp. DV-2018c]|nr:hypothetical protein N7461_004123 [Penicillium sp. DV-2018c]KAJ5566449.1 hypothetical protein N7535_008087 [Penicillium sp. DV-2018c]